MSLRESQHGGTLDLGDLVIVLLAGTLETLRDRLWDAGFPIAADTVADLVHRCDRHAEEVGNGD